MAAVMRDRKLWAYLALVAVFAYMVGVLAAGVARAEYVGSRWRDTRICVQNKIHDPVIRAAMVESIVDMREHTVLHVVNYGSSDCVKAGYRQVIVVESATYANSWYATTLWTGGHTWAYTPNVRKATWMNESPVTIRFNQRYRLTAHQWSHVASHELGHAVGLGHVTRTCAAVMTVRSDCGGGYRNTGWWDRVGNATYPGVDVIYSW